MAVYQQVRERAFLTGSVKSMMNVLIVVFAMVDCAASHADEMLALSLSHPPIMPYTNAIVAAQGGYFQKAGLDVKRKVLASTDILRAALASGDIDVVALSTDTLIRGHVAGLDWKFLYPADIYDSSRPDAVLVGRPDVTLSTARDFEGKVVAAATGTIAESAFRGWMKDNGGDPSKVKIVDVPFAQINSGLQSKNIDAGHIVEPFITTAVEGGIGKIVAKHLDDVSPRFLISGYIAKRSWIDANPEKAKRFVSALAASTAHVDADPAEVLPILEKETRIKSSLLQTIFPIHYVISTSIKQQEIQSVIDFLARNGDIPASFSYKEIISSYFPVSD